MQTVAQAPGGGGVPGVQTGQAQHRFALPAIAMQMRA